jgi:deoxyribonuclease-4
VESPTNLRIGIHTSISGSLEKAALKAAELGANTFQIFSASPRMWRANTPDPAAIRLLRAAREKHDLYPLVIHDSYLINLASCSEALRQQSMLAFRGEIERALLIGAEYLVAHPGNCKGYSREEGIVAVIKSLVQATHGLDAQRVTILLENTAGAGECLGSRADDLKLIREHAARFTDFQIGYCVDTCHAFAAGSDAISFVA